MHVFFVHNLIIYIKKFVKDLTKKNTKFDSIYNLVHISKN
jgi:hypothetical protein